MTYIVVAAPDATGKTTLTQALATMLKVSSLEEKALELPQFVRWLEAPSTDTLAGAQMAFLHHAVERQRVAAQRGGVVERCLSDNFHVFCVLARRFGRITSTQFASLKHEYEALHEMASPPSLLVYLETSTNVVARSVEARDRVDDRIVTRDDLALQIDLYAAWISSWTQSPILTLPALKLSVASMTAIIVAKVKDLDLDL